MHLDGAAGTLYGCLPGEKIETMDLDVAAKTLTWI